MDLVSVIIPIYKAEQYLDHCISSVVNQTYSNLEIILVDDGSPDHCPLLCDVWAAKDNRIRVIHQENAGLSAARNAGLDIASGKFVFLLDSDDYIASFAIERLLISINENNADIAICDFSQGDEIDYLFENDFHTAPEIISNSTALLRIYANDKKALQYGAACFKLYRQELFKEISFPVGKLFEDIYTTHKLIFRAHKIVVVDIPLYYYYQHPSSIMNSAFNIKKLDYLQALVERVDFFNTYNLAELSQIAYDELLHSLIWEYSRTRDILHSHEGMNYVTKLFRENYRKGYANRRYPKEGKIFLSVFNRNPELIILYWKICGKLNHIFKKV